MKTVGPLNLMENLCCKQDVVGNMSCRTAGGVRTGLVRRCNMYKHAVYKRFLALTCCIYLEFGRKNTTNPIPFQKPFFSFYELKYAR
jgi:hypothetical protein